jgi:predicted MFS family arabinose efflux permease
MITLINFRSMSSLSWASYCIILAMIAALIALVVTFFINSTEHSDEATVGTVQELMRPKSLWWSLGLVVVFCFGYSQVWKWYQMVVVSASRNEKLVQAVLNLMKETVEFSKI